jgi:hypothetical protein
MCLVSSLQLVPGYPKLNLLVCTVGYILISHRLYKITINLRAMFIPETTEGLRKSFAGMGVVVSICVVMAWFLEVSGLLSPTNLLLAITMTAAALLFLFNSRLRATNKKSMGYNFLLVSIAGAFVVACAIMYVFVNHTPARLVRPELIPAAPAPAGADAVKKPSGVAANVVLGAVVVLLSSVMLFTQDSFAGFSNLSITVVRMMGTKLQVSWSEAYDMLNSKILSSKGPSVVRRA